MDSPHNYLPQAGPAGIMYLEKQEQSKLADFIKQCELDKKNLKSYEKAYTVCAEKNELSPQWWQTPAGVAGIFILGLLAGTAVD